MFANLASEKGGRHYVRLSPERKEEKEGVHRRILKKDSDADSYRGWQGRKL